MTQQESEKKRRNYLYRYINFIASDAGLDREDRLDFAKQMFEGIDAIESYTELSIEDLEDLLFVLKGWRAIQAIRLGNGNLLATARVVVEKSQETAEATAERQTRDGSWD